jgi:hypothetical protein
MWLWVDLVMGGMGGRLGAGERHYGRYCLLLLVQ